MAVVVRIIGVSLLAAGLGAGLGFVLFGRGSDATGVSFILGCVGAIIGALAGTAQETVAALQQKPPV